MYPMPNTVSWQASREQVLRFWRAIELFTPPKVPDVSPKERVDRVERSSPLPWEDGHRLRRVKLEQDQVWRHVVYGGVFSLDRVHDVLEDVFGKDEENFDPPRRGESALFALTVTGEGRVLLGSEVFSTCAWAVGRTRNPGPTNPDWLQGFDVVAGELGFAFQRIAAALDDDEQAAGLRAQGHLVGRPMHFEYLERLVEVVADRFGVSQLLKPAEIRVQSVIVAIKRQFDADGQEFLNSFIADDLERVADAVRRGEYGAALDAYLQEEQQVDPARRVDVRTDPQIVLDWVVPDRVPLGRWPASSARPLALSQQFAVNGAMALSGASGLFAVNGPPGTGKTTLLRELVAAIVVERAHRLAALPTPSAAFGTTEHRWQTGEYTRVIKEWTPELTGFEIVVASANNGAVENVTLEIPSADAIDDEWREQAKYFDDLATSLLGKPAWGVVAARLGKKANRQQFANKFWFGERGLLEMLKRHPREPGPDWARAVAEFHRAYQDVAEMREARERASVTLAAIRQAEQACEQAHAGIESAGGILAELRASCRSAEAAMAAAEQEHAVRERDRLEHRQFRPGLVEAVFTLGRAVAEWRTEDRLLAEALRAAKRRLHDTGHELNSLRAAHAEAEEELEQYRQALAVAQTALSASRAEFAGARRRWGRFIPTDTGWEDELATPWTDESWNRARTRLFLQALRLHQAFLAGAANDMRRNLHAAIDLVQGLAPAGVPEAAALAAWRSLFFVVPVISTTFASLARLFGHLGRESIGWLFIDEAGQAAPQAATGAIWRSRRVIVVGDPRQLKPIVTLPFTAQQALRGHFGAAEKWLPSRTSVQQLADEVSPLGTYLPDDDRGRVWIGAPLRVHRRCDEPMFGIANTVAYGGLMVFGTPSRKELSLPPSTWIDIPAVEASGHWIPEQGKVAQELLDSVTADGVDLREVFLITPFLAVADQLRCIVHQFPDVRAGTIHTTQGKEADIVIFVLGGHPQRPGARQWAAEGPNLLNVAVSRAKRRLYVIGDHIAWEPYRYFNVLAERLPRSTWPPEAE
jgi:tetratricopeptide (TPR) repeat protein